MPFRDQWLEIARSFGLRHRFLQASSCRQQQREANMCDRSSRKRVYSLSKRSFGGDKIPIVIRLNGSQRGVTHRQFGIECHRSQRVGSDDLGPIAPPCRIAKLA